MAAGGSHPSPVQILEESSIKALQPGTANQDVHALMQKSSTILQITPPKLNRNTIALQFKNVYVKGYAKNEK